MSNIIKKMDVGDIRPKEVIEVEDDKNQVFSNSNVQASSSHDQNQASTSDDKVQDQLQVLVHHLNQMIKQMQAIKFKCSNQLMLQESSFGFYNW